MDLLLHPAVRSQLDPGRFRAGQTFVFFGQSGQGKRSAAIEMARRLNCSGDDENICRSCRLFEAMSFPDLHIIEPEDTSVGIDQVRVLQQQLALSPYQESSARFVIIDAAETLTSEAQNALLKLIEEPPPQTTVVLVATDVQSLLPTVRSRTIPVYFPPVSDSDLASWLGSSQTTIIGLADGAPGLARRLEDDPDLLHTMTEIDRQAEQLLSGALFDRLVLIKDLASDSTKVSILFSRLVSRARRSSRVSPDATMLPAVEQLSRHIKSGVTARAALETLAIGV